MNRIPRHRNRILSTVAVSALAATTVLGAVAPSHAVNTTINPFSANNGFTLLVAGNAELGNGELEGSLAAFGDVSSTNINGYPLVHQVAGMGDYTPPVVDGQHVRLYAQSFTGAGSFDVSNAGHNSDPNARNASIKLAETTGLTGSQRGGGLNGGDFIRVMNADTGLLDLKAVSHADPAVAVSALQSTSPSVAAHFSGIGDHLDDVTEALTALYTPATGLGNVVTVGQDGGSPSLSGFSATKPNIVNYSDIGGGAVKLSASGGYVPSAQAPLIIKVNAGTSVLSGSNFEGWSSSSGAQQSYARYIMYDLSALEGQSVTINGVELGAIWAPGVFVQFNSNSTINGQMFVGDLTTAGAGEIHHHTFLGELPLPPTPATPTITGALYKDMPSTQYIACLADGVIVQTVAVDNLDPNHNYSVFASLVDENGDPTGVTANATAGSDASGNLVVTLNYTIGVNTLTAFGGQVLTSMVDVVDNGTVVATLNSLTDTAQQITVGACAPTPPAIVIDTYARNLDTTLGKTLQYGGGTIVDEVTITGLTPGASYILNGVVNDQLLNATGVSNSVQVTADVSGEVYEEMEFVFDAATAASYAGQTLSVGQLLLDNTNGQELARHVDAADADQAFVVDTAPIPVPIVIDTYARNLDATLGKTLQYGGGTIVDEVTITGLDAGVDYFIRGAVYDSATSAPVAVTQVAQVTADVNGEVYEEMEFVFDGATAAQRAGKSLFIGQVVEVAATGSEVARHIDATDADQTFTVATAPQGPGGNNPGGGNGNTGGNNPGTPGNNSGTGNSGGNSGGDPDDGTGTTNTGGSSVVIDTRATTSGKDSKVLPIAGGTVWDAVTLTGLESGEKYTLEGSIVHSDGKATGLVATKKFTASGAKDSATVKFAVTAGQARSLEGQTLVVFETLKDSSGNVVATHKDLRDIDQTFAVEKSSDGTAGDDKSAGGKDSASSDKESLARTGAEVTTYAVASSALVIAGVAFLLAARSRSRSRSVR